MGTTVVSESIVTSDKVTVGLERADLFVVRQCRCVAGSYHTVRTQVEVVTEGVVFLPPLLQRLLPFGAPRRQVAEEQLPGLGAQALLGW